MNDSPRDTRLIFVGDPMCSWCYGFSKELHLLHERHPELPIDVLVGGLNAGETQTLSDEMKRFRLGHWHRVEKASGLPFDREAFMRRDNFVYDTEPACRMVVAARRLAPESSHLDVFRAIQHAFYAEGRDTTNGAVLADVASRALARQGVVVAPADLLAAWQDKVVIAVARAEFQKVRGWGIRSFPTLLLWHGDEVSVLAPGYMSADEMEPRLAAATGAPA